MVKELEVSLSIFYKCLENWDKIKRKAAKGTEVGSRTKRKICQLSKLNASVALPDPSRPYLCDLGLVCRTVFS